MNIQTHSCATCGAPLNLADAAAGVSTFSCDHCGAVATLLRAPHVETLEERTERELGEIARDYDAHQQLRQLAAAPEIAQEKLVFGTIAASPFILAILLAGLLITSDFWPVAIVLGIAGGLGLAAIARRAFRRRRKLTAPSPDFSKIALEPAKVGIVQCEPPPR